MEDFRQPERALIKITIPIKRSLEHDVLEDSIPIWTQVGGELRVHDFDNSVPYLSS